MRSVYPHVEWLRSAIRQKAEAERASAHCSSEFNAMDVSGCRPHSFIMPEIDTAGNAPPHPLPLSNFVLGRYASPTVLIVLRKLLFGQRSEGVDDEHTYGAYMFEEAERPRRQGSHQLVEKSVHSRFQRHLAQRLGANVGLSYLSFTCAKKRGQCVVQPARIRCASML